MGSVAEQWLLPTEEEEEECLTALQYATAQLLPLVLRAACDLELFEVIAKAGPHAMLSSHEIASQLEARNPEASNIIDRILRFLASRSVVSCKLHRDENGPAMRLYGLLPMSYYFLKADNRSLYSVLSFMMQDYMLAPWEKVREAVLEGGVAFEKAHGMHLFEFMGKMAEANDKFNQNMANLTNSCMTKILKSYKGFEGVRDMVDVGGGTGANLSLILSKYPNITAINFDLPHVISHAPHIPGVEHVGGDMFVQVPQAEVIFMKWILHDWGDAQCLKILKNCYAALLKGNGKVVLVEAIAPELPETDTVSRFTISLDVSVVQLVPGAKERTKEEFEALGKAAGFSTFKLVYGPAYGYWVMELHK